MRSTLSSSSAGRADAVAVGRGDPQRALGVEDDGAQPAVLAAEELLGVAGRPRRSPSSGTTCTRSPSRAPRNTAPAGDGAAAEPALLGEDLGDRTGAAGPT